MRAVASLVLATAAVVAFSAAQAQSVDSKTKPAAEAAVKPSTTTAPAAKAAAQAKPAASVDSGKSRVEGVATQRSVPADMKKSSDDCQHKGNASDA